MWGVGGRGTGGELMGTFLLCNVVLETAVNPQVLHPTPYILHLTPYTVRPTPYTLHPKP